MASNGKLTRTHREFIAHASAVTCVKFGQKSGGQLLATGSKDSTVKLWSHDRPNCLMTLSGPASSCVESLSFNKSDQYIASGYQTGLLKIWDIEATKVMRQLSGHKSTIQVVDFHPVGEFTASAAADGNIKLWDLKRKGCINTYKGHAGCSSVTCLQFSPDGKWLLSADNIGRIKMWDLIKGCQLCEYNQHTSSVSSVKFHSTDLLMATACTTGIVKLWDLDTQQLLAETKGTDQFPPPPIRAVGFHPEGQCLYAVTSKSLVVFGWEPLTHHASVVIPYSNTADICITSNQLYGAELNDNRVTSFIVDIQKIAPLGSSSSDESSVANSCCRPNTSSGRLTFNVGARSLTPASKPGYKERVSTALAVDEEENKVEDVHIDDPNYRDVLLNNKAADMRANAAAANSQQKLIEEKKKEKKLYHEELDEEREDRYLKYMCEGHAPLMSVLSRRLNNLQVISNEWRTNKKMSIDVAIGLKDQGALVDLLDVINCNPKFLNLDMCQSLLPTLLELLQSKYEYYIHISLSTLRLIVNNFGSLVRENIRVPPPTGQVDFSRQERYEKCLSCYSTLMKIRADLELKFSRYTGRLDLKLHEIHSLIVDVQLK